MFVMLVHILKTEICVASLYYDFTELSMFGNSWPTGKNALLWIGMLVLHLFSRTLRISIPGWVMKCVTGIQSVFFWQNERSYLHLCSHVKPPAIWGGGHVVRWCMDVCHQSLRGGGFICWHSPGDRLTVSPRTVTCYSVSFCAQICIGSGQMSDYVGVFVVIQTLVMDANVCSAVQTLSQLTGEEIL